GDGRGPFAEEVARRGAARGKVEAADRVAGDRRARGAGRVHAVAVPGRLRFADRVARRRQIGELVEAVGIGGRRVGENAAAVGERPGQQNLDAGNRQIPGVERAAVVAVEVDRSGHAAG